MSALRPRLARLRSTLGARGPARPGSPSPHRGDHPSLLDRVVAGSLEPDYEMVARRRTERPPPGGAGARPRRPARRRATTAVVLTVFVLLLVAAALENREDEPADALVRETLVSTATQRRDDLAELQSDVLASREANAGLAARSREAAQERAEAVSELRRVAAVAGFQSVTGPGLRLVVSDAPPEQGGELIRSDDLALLVDGLWEAGAEAISINGERLTARSAITTTNVSINVNRRPLTAPYAVSAIGDRRVLEAELAETQGGGAWFLLVQEYGFGYEAQPRDDLVLPAARDLLLRTCGECFPHVREPGGRQRGD